jgi:hypothetical protein
MLQRGARISRKLRPFESPHEAGRDLELTPTYLFTIDGIRQYLRHEELLQGIKRAERNAAVTSQLHLWSDRLNRRDDLFTPNYPFLGFDLPPEFETDVDIPDEEWSAAAAVADVRQPPLPVPSEDTVSHQR